MPRPTNAGEYLTIDGAAKLAGMIRRFWFDKGHLISVWVEPIRVKPAGADKSAGPSTFYQVRSNLVNGRPVRTPLVRA
jgi:hypothetical protein